MARNATPDYLVLDREDPESPRLVIARALRAAPIVTDLPGDGQAGGDALLGVLDWDQLDWVRDILGEDVGVQLTRPGVAARLRRWADLPTPVPAATCHGGHGCNGNGHGGKNGDAAADAGDGDGRDDWFEGWTDDRVEHYTGEFPEAQDIEPFDGWTSPYDDEDEITARTWQRD